MTTFKDLQTRVEAAEEQAKHAEESRAEMEAELLEIKARAEAYILEARSRISKADEAVRHATAEALKAKSEAWPFGRERDHWWQRVFLAALGMAEEANPAKRVAYAANVASEAVKARAGLLQDGVLPVDGGDPPRVEVPAKKSRRGRKAKKAAPEVQPHWLPQEDESGEG